MRPMRYAWGRTNTITEYMVCLCVMGGWSRPLVTSVGTVGTVGTVGRWPIVGTVGLSELSDVGLLSELSDCRTDGRQWKTEDERGTMSCTVGITVGHCRTLSDCRTVGPVGLSDNCRITVGLLSDYCRNLLSDCRTGAQAATRT